MTEQQLVNQILDYLHAHGAWAIRINSGGTQKISIHAPRGERQEARHVIAPGEHIETGSNE